MTPETSERLRNLRAAVLDNTITDDELREGLALLRQERATSASRVVKPTKKQAAAANASSLLDELDGL